MTDLDLIASSVRRFAQEVIAPALHDLTHYPDHPLPPRLLPGLGELGLWELEASDRATLATVLETLSSVAAAPAAVVLANAFGRSLARARRPELVATNGSGPVTFAYPIYAEPGLTDALPRLARHGSGWQADGTARLVVNAPHAKRLVLPVREAGGELALIAVDAGSRGVLVGEPLLTLGLRGAPTTDVVLTSAAVTPERVLATGPEAVALAQRVARELRGPALAISCGVLGSSLRGATDYARERYQGGSMIVEHQEVRAILGRMAEDHALCRDAVLRLSRDPLPEHHSLALFVHAKERAAHATTDGVQLLGGNGYMEDYGQERCMRDAKQAQCVFGRTDHQRQQMVAALLAEARP